MQVRRKISRSENMKIGSWKRRGGRHFLKVKKMMEDEIKLSKKKNP